MNDRLIIGIVGKIGSGKSLVSNIMKEYYNFLHIDVDKFGHIALEKSKDKIIETFGNNILNNKNEIDRKILGDIVFSNLELLYKLNSIVHPIIKNDIIDFIKNIDDKRVVIDASLLFEIGLDEICDYIITIETPDDLILNRVKKYRKWEEDRIKKVLLSQEYLKFLKVKTNFIIFNNGDIEKLKKQLEFFMYIVLDKTNNQQIS